VAGVEGRSSWVAESRFPAAHRRSASLGNDQSINYPDRRFLTPHSFCCRRASVPNRGEFGNQLVDFLPFESGAWLGARSEPRGKFAKRRSRCRAPDTSLSGVSRRPWPVPTGGWPRQRSPSVSWRRTRDHADLTVSSLSSPRFSCVSRMKTSHRTTRERQTVLRITGSCPTLARRARIRRR
jgi:hypothetical protein